MAMVDFRWLGLIDFEEALKIQIETADAVRQGLRAPVILACSHSSVITLGKRSQSFDDILVAVESLREQKIKIVACDRGGHATLHNPGQMVLYPILPLRKWRLGVRNYVECLELASAHYFAERGIEVDRAYEPGLWVSDKKIASFGIRVDRGVSLHGAALNIFNNLSQFSLIRQCGRKVEATHLSAEMAQFMGSIPAWDLENEALLWAQLFQKELKSLGLDERWPPPLQEEPSIPEHP